MKDRKKKQLCPSLSGTKLRFLVRSSESSPKLKNTRRKKYLQETLKPFTKNPSIVHLSGKLMLGCSLAFLAVALLMGLYRSEMALLFQDDSLLRFS